MKITFKTSLTRGQQIGSGVLCACASSLFLAPGMFFPGAEVAPVMVVGGIAGPLSITALFWSAKSTFTFFEERAETHESARRGEAQQRQAEALRAQQDIPVTARVVRRVIDGEVVAR